MCNKQSKQYNGMWGKIISCLGRLLHRTTRGHARRRCYPLPLELRLVVRRVRDGVLQRPAIRDGPFGCWNGVGNTQRLVPSHGQVGRRKGGTRSYAPKSMSSASFSAAFFPQLTSSQLPGYAVGRAAPTG